MKYCLAAALALISYVSGQNSSSSNIDPSLVQRPDDGIDFPGCYSDLATADRDGNGFVKQNEYLNFIQLYGKRICFSEDALTLQQSATFNTLACICLEEKGDPSCCLGDNARIPTSGATLPISKQTPHQQNFLTTVCKLTAATISGKCPPVVLARGAPPSALVAPLPASGGGLSKGAMWGIIAGALALALLCCCCCCVYRKKKMKQQWEEEEEARRQELERSAKSLPPVEQAPAVIPGPHLLRKTGIDPEKTPRDMAVNDVDPELGAGAAASGATEADDSDDDEEGRKRRGGGVVPPPDEENGLRVPTAGRLPEPQNPFLPPQNLRPIPPKDDENDEWDQPGRNIDFPKDKDEMSAGEVDHYDPDGGVNFPEREGKEPLNWKKDWNRPKPEDPDEVDHRKHRIQSGLGEGEVWDKLGEDETERSKQAPKGDVFDWVVQSALGVLDNHNDEAGR